MPRPIKSNDVIVFIDDIPATGCVDYSLNSDLGLWGQSSLGAHTVGDYLLTENQTHKLDLSWHWGLHSPDTQLGIIDSLNGIVSSGSHNIVIKDTAEQQLISGCYLTNFGVSASVGELVSAKASFDCNTRSHNTDSVVDPHHEPRTGHFHVFQPQDVKVTNVAVQPFVSYDSGCVQSFNMDVSIPRIPITKIGSKVPVTRAINDAIEVSVEIEVVKDRVQNMDSNYLNETLRTTHTLTALFGDGISGQYSVNVNNVSLQSLSESVNLDGTNIITYSYNGKINQNGVVISSAGDLVSSDSFLLISSDGFTLTT